MSSLLYAALCVFAPLAWGLVVVWISNRIESSVRRRQGPDNDQKPPPPTEYYI